MGIYKQGLNRKQQLMFLLGIALFKKLCIAIKGNDLTQIREEIAAYIL